MRRRTLIHTQIFRFYKWYDESILFYNTYTDSCLVVSSTGKDYKGIFIVHAYMKNWLR